MVFNLLSIVDEFYQV